MRTNTTLLFLALVLAACSNDTGSSSATTTLTLGMAGLEDLGSDYVYEGWLIADGVAEPAGRFSVDADGNATPDTFEIDTAIAEAATAYVLTIEPAEGDDPGPSNVHILAGPVTGGTASLTTEDSRAIGTDFSSAAGAFILETPSSMAVADDYANGIWWLVPGGDGAMPGLDLPALPDGWTYEGGGVGPDGPISTGTFDAADVADSDGAGPDAGPDPTPPFPGQDFIDPAQTLTDGYMAVISVEPVPDNSPAPFPIKPLADMSIDDVMAPMTLGMDNIVADNLPGGSVSLGLGN